MALVIPTQNRFWATLWGARITSSKGLRLSVIPVIDVTAVANRVLMALSETVAIYHRLVFHHAGGAEV
jgi:hypothetical protein